MSFTMKMLAVSVLVVAMVVLTSGTAPATEPPVSETAADEEDASVTEPPPPEKEDMEPVPESTPDEEADEPGSGSEMVSVSLRGRTIERGHYIAKRATRCPCGWSLYRSGCVRFFSVAKTWAGAQRHCQKMGANLASVHNRREENWMKRLAGSRSAWVGLSDAQQERHWFWINGARITYQNWCRRQPNNSGKKQHCVQFNWSGGKCWDDDHCLARKAYICKVTPH